LMFYGMQNITLLTPRLFKNIIEIVELGDAGFEPPKFRRYPALGITYLFHNFIILF